jgi:DNA-binding NarL/FixJ family response regulator
MDDVRIMLVEDHHLVRQGVFALLSQVAEFKVIGEAGDGLEAIPKAQELQPDIVILDISMPKLRGIEAIKEIIRVSPDSRILVLSMYNKEEYIRQSLKNGASGYLLKDSAADELIAAIKYVSRGEVYLSPTISGTIVADWLQASAHGRTDGQFKSPLTDREMEVLKLLAEGHSNRETGELLHISVKTVETHRSRIMEKLELKNIADLVKYAIKNDLTELS